MKLVILERDGVINAAGPVLAPDDWLPLPGSLEAIARLHRAGYRIVVTTRQPEIGRRGLSVEMLNRIHARLLEAVRHRGAEIEALLVCPHAPDEHCRCAKPAPGLLEELAERLKINLSGVHVVGHDADDVAAARAVGALPVLVGAASSAPDVPAFESLAAFSAALLDGAPGKR
jgi:D-glycero-D-manno-heptose 1,7-bisphosphate phosphatase